MATGDGMAARFTLRELLEAHGISQSEMARRSRVGFNTISRMCQNHAAQVSLATLAKLVGAFHESGATSVTVADLIAIEPATAKAAKVSKAATKRRRISIG